MAKKNIFKNLKNRVKLKLSNFLIGFSVLIILFLIIAFSFKNNNNSSNNTQNKSAFTKIKEIFKPKEEQNFELKKYIVKENDSLWLIAENAYGSGFNSYDIANANKIENPDLIEVGQEIILPDVETKEPTIGETLSLNNESYLVLEGDSLWSIAQKIYGDPYKWIKLAEFNKIQNPDYIFPGTLLFIP